MESYVSGIFAEERRNEIFELLRKNKRITITELTEQFQIGSATIRRDLAKMEQNGLITRTHGGAIERESAYYELSLNLRGNQNQNAKLGIAKAASGLIYSGEVLMIYGGSTTQILAEQLKTKKNLKVLTNSAGIAFTLLGINNNVVMLTGGEMKVETGVMVGPMAIQAISQYRADRAILGMSSIFCDEGFFTVSPHEAELKRKMIQLSSDVTIVVDSSKFGRKSFSLVCGFSEVNRIITDSGIDEETLANIKSAGVEVIVV